MLMPPDIGFTLSNQSFEIWLQKPHDFATVRCALRTLKTRWPDVILPDVEIALAEALNNIAEHGGATVVGQPVYVRWSHSYGILNLWIQDSGRLIPKHIWAEPHLPKTECTLDDLPEGGFGWSLIHSVCLDVKYYRQGSQNFLHLQFEASNTP